MGERKVIIVTGATSGIGEAAAARFACDDATVVLACRDPDKGERTADRMRRESRNDAVHAMACDLAVQASIAAFAEAFKQRFGKLDVLVNNAGIMNPRRKLTPDGIEQTFATNYLGPFLLTHLMLDTLAASRQGRIVNVASEGHRNLLRVRLDDLQGEKSYNGVRAYNLSKVALIMFTYRLAAKLAHTSITVNVLHPGIVHTNIWPDEFFYLRMGSAVARWFAVDADKGAENTIYLATAPQVAPVSGAYFQGLKPTRSKAVTYDPDTQLRMWNAAAKLVGLPQDT
jgi:NAD(P)-dependent dehydrogenase (short-subunit alcohol dehydrogenase family)